MSIYESEHSSKVREIINACAPDMDERLKENLHTKIIEVMENLATQIAYTSVQAGRRLASSSGDLRTNASPSNEEDAAQPEGGIMEVSRSSLGSSQPASTSQNEVETAE